VTARNPRTEMLVEPHLRKGEHIEATVRGAISGFSRRSAVAGGVAVLAAVIVPDLLRLNFLGGVLFIAAVITLGFMALLSLVGKPMARRHRPALSTPFITLAVTDKRLLLVERGAGPDASRLVEEVPRLQVQEVAYAKGGWLHPHRLGYATPDGQRRFEFPRMERVAAFAEVLER